LFNTKGQERSFLRPLHFEATELGELYRDQYANLTNKLSAYPLARTFKHTPFPSLTSIEKTDSNKYVLYYRGYKVRCKLNINGDTIRYKRPKKIIETQVVIDSSLAILLSKLFKRVIAETRYGQEEFFLTHAYYCYFFTWVIGQGNIIGRAQMHILDPLYDSLLNVHQSLVKYATVEESRQVNRVNLVSLAKEILVEYP